jgi:hypothetical protein
MKWHTRATRARSKDYAILAEVDKDWTDDALTLVATARSLSALGNLESLQLKWVDWRPGFGQDMECH